MGLEKNFGNEHADAAEDFLSGFLNKFLGRSHIEDLFTCSAEVADDIGKMKDAIDAINENGPDATNVLDIVKMVLEWPKILVDCINALVGMERGFLAFEAWADQFNDPDKVAYVIASHGLSNLGDIIDLVKEMADQIDDEDWEDAGISLAKMIEIVMGPVDSDIATDLSCWLSAQGRGVGKMRTVCPAGEERKARICYPLCDEGYTGRGPLCWQDCPEDGSLINDGNFCRKPRGEGRWNAECPENMTNIGISCRKDRYGRGVGHSPDCEEGME